jgi:hypothetical protein
VIAADDGAIAVMAGAEHRRRVGSDVVEVDSGMAGGIDRAECAVGLFHQHRDRGVPAGCQGNQKDNKPAESD